MKSTLLLPALLLATAAFAQNTVPAFYAPTGEDMYDTYTIVDSSTDLGEANSTGENVTWNFNSLTAGTTSATEVVTPSADDITMYPGSTLLVQTSTATSGGENVSRYFFAQDLTGGLSLTGAETSGMSLNYNTNNAFLGTFPLSYGYTNTDDNVAGSFQYGNFSGTFTGTGTTAVDAYGTLTVNIGIADNTPVTRIKTVQDVAFTVSGLPGTLTQTIYSYYSNTLTTGPIFRSITSHITVTGLIDMTDTVYESYMATELSTKQVAKNKIVLAPNPVNDVLHFAGTDNISKVTVTDAAGRTVLTGDGNNVSAGSLGTGIYYATAQTETGNQTVKFIKK